MNKAEDNEPELIEPYLPERLVKAMALSAADFAAGLAAAFKGADALLMIVQLTNGFVSTLLQKEWLQMGAEDDSATEDQ